MERVTAKKNLGQHFLHDKSYASRIASAFTGEGCDSVLEIGPGTGILTRFLIERNFADFRVIEIDRESVAYLRNNMPELSQIIEGDFLRADLNTMFSGTIGITGNFPYNISSQILFKALSVKDKVPEITGMFQKEVAERICTGPGSKTYGILSVLIQAWYSTEYLFTVPPSVFSPPPKVKSGVIRIKRNSVKDLGCDPDLFVKVVKAAFNQRRKTLRNSIRSAFVLTSEECPYFHLRPEQLGIGSFIDLTDWVGRNSKPRVSE